MPGMPVAKLKVLVEADTKAAEKRLREFHRHLEESFAKSGDRAGRAADSGVAQGIGRNRAVILGQANRVGDQAGRAFSTSFAEQVARRAGGKLLGDVKVPVNADATGLRREVARATKVAGVGQEIRVRIRADQSTGSLLGRSLRAATKDAQGFRDQVAALGFPAFASGISLAASALAALGSAAIGAAASVAPLIGLLGALPGLGAAAGQGFGVLKLAFGGVGDAVKALGKAQVKGAVSAGQSAAAQRAAAEQIRNARMAVGRAERDAADAAVEGSRRIQDAQQNLSDSQRTARHAQEDLTRARRDARLALIDLRLEVARNALSQERAVLNVEEALQRLNAIRSDPTADPLKLRDADLDYREALQSLKEITEQRRRANIDLARANRVGINGSDQVRSASERVADAQRSVAEAVRGVRDAQQQAARAGADAAARIAEAHHDLAAAAAAAAERTSKLPAALQSVNEELSKLSPAGQRFARVLYSYKPIIDRLRRTAQEGLFPGVESGLRRLKLLEPVARDVVDRTAKVFGRLADAGARMISSGPWRRDLQTIGRRNAVVIERAGHTALNLADALRNVTIAAGPLVDWLSKLVLGWSESAKQAAQTGRETGKLGAFFEDTRRTLEQWLRIGGSFAKILFNIGRAARPLGDDLVASLDKAAASMAKLTGSARGQGELRRFFDDMRPTLRELGLLARDVAKAFIALSRDSDLPKVISQIRTELLPVLIEFLSRMRDAAPVAIKIIGLVVGSLLKLINTVPGLGTLVGALAGLSVAFKAIKLFNTALGINAVARALLGFGPAGAAVHKLAGAMKTANLASLASTATTGAAATSGWAAALARFAGPAAIAAGVITLLVQAMQKHAEQAKQLDTLTDKQAEHAKKGVDANGRYVLGLGKVERATKSWQAANQVAAETQARATARLARTKPVYDAAAAQRAYNDALTTVNSTLIGYRQQIKDASDELGTSLVSDTADFKTWSTDVALLIKKGMSPKEIIALRDRGPQFMHQFATATGTELTKLKAIWQTRIRAARIAAQLEALLAGRNSAQSIATGLNSKDKIVRDAARQLLSHLPKKVQTRVEVLYDQARNIKVLQRFRKDMSATIGGQPVLIDPRTGNMLNTRTGKTSVFKNARGNVYNEQHSAQIARAGAMRVWAEPETGGEAYIPLAKSKRPRSERILGDVASRFGMQLQRYAQGGIKPGGGRPRLGTGKGPQYAIQKLLAIAASGYGGDVGRSGKQGADGLTPHVRAAREYIRRTFGVANIGGFANRNIAGTGTKSDHAYGKALDVMTTNRKLHNAVIRWFVGHPAAKYWISYSRIAMARQNWKSRAYSGRSPHRDHVHLSFNRLGGILDRVGKLASFANGGRVRSTGPIYAHGGEGVLNRRAMARVGTGGLDAMNRGGGVGGVYISPGAVQIVVQGDVGGEAVLRRLEGTVDRKLDDLVGLIVSGRRS